MPRTRREFLGQAALGSAGALLLTGMSGSQAAATPGILDVRDFGARGDGQADDGPAIQRALDAAMERAGAVFVAPSTGGYRIATAPLVITAPVMLFGTGPIGGQVPMADQIPLRGSTLFNPTTDRDLLVIRNGRPPALAGVVIRDLYFRGNRGVAGATAGSGIVIEGGAPGNAGAGSVNGVLLENVTIKNCSGHGLHISDNVFNSNFWAVFADRCGGHGIYLETTQLAGGIGQNRFIGCNTSRNGGDGIRQNSRGANFVFGLQTVENAGWGVNVMRANLRISDSKLEDNNAGQFWAQAPAGALTSLVGCLVGQQRGSAASVKIEANGVYVSDIVFSNVTRAAAEIEVSENASGVELGRGLRMLNGQRPVLRDRGRGTVRADSGAPAATAPRRRRQP